MTGAPARLLAIAGSDSSGGAGIQADIKTATALGVYAMTAVTAVTAQDTTGIGGIQLVAPDIVREQISRCLSDIGADAIKTGMFGSAENVRAAAEAIAALAPYVPLVVDPVLASTSGTELGDEAVLRALKSELIAKAAVVTPNLPETARLCGFAVEGRDDLLRAGQTLLALGARAALIKGGHGSGDTLVDFLFVPDAPPQTFITKPVDTRHTHGTGCTLATAIACGLAQGAALGEAIERAHDFVQTAIRTAPGFGRGNGPLNHMFGIRTTS